MTSQTLLQAVDLLRRRLSEVETEITALRSEATEIAAALASLSAVHETSRPSHVPLRVTASGTIVTGGRRGTIREAVERLFLETPREVSLDQLVDRLKEDYQGDREDEQFRGTLRTALWTLRKEGTIVATQGKGNHIATKWTIPENASAPDVSGAEGGVTSTSTGGDSNAHIDQDHGDSFEDGNRDDRGGASVAEVPSELSTSSP